MSDPEVIRLEGKLNSHEAVCAERYAGILHRMGRLEKIMMAATGTMIIGLFAIVGFLMAPHIGRLP